MEAVRRATGLHGRAAFHHSSGRRERPTERVRKTPLPGRAAGKATGRTKKMSMHRYSLTAKVPDCRLTGDCSRIVVALRPGSARPHLFAQEQYRHVLDQPRPAMRRPANPKL